MVISISLPDELLSELDKVLGEEWYASRSEVIRQAVRKYISEYRSLERIEGEVVATITVLYNKMEKGEDQLRLQHEFGDIISAFLHSHMDGSTCLEVMVVKGRSKRLKELIDGMKAIRGVRQINFALMGIVEDEAGGA
ncbi:MAG: CopG family ribbon-helix-helix protein [Candidatus Verstraetearchaeota archaeon]|nr:CopG family ribbon-helix-helix protein [Candidatus Verstraetearchaeota archaeon]